MSHYSKFCRPLNFRFRQILYTTFLVIIDKFNNNQWLHSPNFVKFFHNYLQNVLVHLYITFFCEHLDHYVHKAGNTLEAEASRGEALHPRCAKPRIKECFQFLRSAACSVHTTHEGNSSDLPHFDLPTTDSSDRGNH